MDAAKIDKADISNKINHYDATIVGAGPVGMSLALVLGQAGYRVLLLEQKTPPPAPSDLEARTLALSYASAHILTQLGIWSRLGDPVPINQVVVTVQGQYGSSTLRPPRSLPALGYVVGFHALQQALQQALAEVGIVIQQANLLGRELGAEAWTLSLAIAPDQAPATTVLSRLLIAAQGGDSCLREEEAIGVVEKDYGHYAVLANLQLEKKSTQAYERFLANGAGAIALLPWRHHLATVVWSVSAATAQTLMAEDTAAFVRLCQQNLGWRSGRFSLAGSRSCYPLRMKIAWQQIASRFLLIGNAAHQLHPLAAQGFNLSLQDVWQIKKLLDADKFGTSDLGNAAFLEKYQQQRQQHQAQIIFATDKITQLLASPSLLPSGLAAAGLGLFDSIGCVKNQFIRMAMGL